MTFPFDETLILENEIALLKPLEKADLAALLPVALSDRNLLQYSPQPIYTEALLSRYIDQALQDRRQRYAFTIFDKRQGAYAGSTSFLSISEADSRLEIGATWIGPAFQRTGLNRQCKFLLLRFAFDTLGAERVELKTDERNLASRRAIEKIGGRYEGTLRSHTVLADGFRRNTVYYSILKPEWNALLTRPDSPFKETTSY